MREEYQYIFRELYMLWFIMIAAMGAVAAVIIALSPERELLTGVSLVTAGSISAIFLYLVLDTRRRLNRDLQEAYAESVSGEARIQLFRKDPLEKSHRRYNLLTIGGQQFAISRAGFDTLKPHESYCVYYAPHTKRILSIAAIASDQQRYSAPVQPSKPKLHRTGLPGVILSGFFD